MKNKEKIKSKKIKEKYFLYLYIIVLISGIIFLFLEIEDIQNSFGIKLDVFIRFSLFIINITVPYLIWQHFFSHILINHQKVKDNRRYIWKSRAIIFRQRRNYYIFYIIVALILAFFSLKTFGNSFSEEVFILLFATVLTLGMPIIQLYFYSNNLIRHTNKNMDNNKIYSYWYMQSLKDENVIKQSQTIIDKTETKKNDFYNTQNEAKENNEEVVDKIDSIDPDTIFHTGMYNKFLTLEKQLIEDKYLNENLNWIAKNHKTKRTDIKSLIIFLLGLLDNRYFLPEKDSKIRVFFESRYSIKIGQNFEGQRRKMYIDKYQIVFFEYKF